MKLTYKALQYQIFQLPSRAKLLYKTSPLQAKLFLIFGTVFGLLFVFINPPMQTADEPQHYWRAYQVAHLHLRADQLPGGRFGMNVPHDVAGIAEDNTSGRAPYARADISNIKKYFQTQPRAPFQPVYFENTAIYPPTAYIPQAIGIKTGEVLHLPLMYGFYLGRLCNLIVWLLLVFFALRLVPFARWTFTAVALLPTVVYQAASLSADATIIGLSFFVIALFLHLITKKVITTSHIVTTGIALAILGMSKQVYVLLLIPFLFIPWRSFQNKKRKLLFLGCLALAVALCTLLWNLSVVNIASIIHVTYRPDQIIVPAAQLSSILHNPLGFLGLIGSTLFFSSFWPLVNGFIGITGWLDISLPGYCYYLAVILILLAVLKDSGQMPRLALTLKALRFILLGTGLALVILLCSLLYIGYTSPTDTFINGLQGRYFIPIALVLLPLAVSQHVQLKIFEKRFVILVCSIFVVILGTTVFCLLDANYFRLIYPI